ncbi:hypothetical protein BC831DRAFT_447193, partial [Entophlyctis helioformis]
MHLANLAIALAAIASTAIGTITARKPRRTTRPIRSAARPPSSDCLDIPRASRNGSKTNSSNTAADHDNCANHSSKQPKSIQWNNIRLWTCRCAPTAIASRSEMHTGCRAIQLCLC